MPAWLAQLAAPAVEDVLGQAVPVLLQVILPAFSTLAAAAITGWLSFRRPRN
jgi:hypothetical protein